MKTSKQLRNLLERPGAVVVPGVYDSLSARICEMAGFEAVFHSGYGTAAARLGQPDIGLLAAALAPKVKAEMAAIQAQLDALPAEESPQKSDSWLATRVKKLIG